MGRLADRAARVRRRRDVEKQRLEDVLKGKAIVLYSDKVRQTIWLVADEEDAALVGEPRGRVYTADEIQQVVSIGDEDVIEDIHAFKDTFDGVIRTGSSKPSAEQTRVAKLNDNRRN